MMATEFRDRDQGNYPNYTVVSETSRPRGQSSIDIKCPFCSTVVEAFLWSMAGGGKRCTCGAKHHKWGYSVPPENKSTAPDNE